MKIIISPAKSLNFEDKVQTSINSKPLFHNDAIKINSELKKESIESLCDLMGISSKLGELNWTRNQDFTKDSNYSKQAIFAFNGDVYDGLDINSLDNDKHQLVNNVIRILSGLYGILKPFDHIKPYRLEMGTKFSINGNKDLYDFWKSKVTNQLKSELAEDELIVNLASNEYFSVINSKKVSNKIISPQFKDYKNGTLKIISFYAKKARGLMSRFIIDNNVKSVNEILSFDSGGYSYSKKDTTDELKPVFIR
ncbi:MAG: peroxide stress protein YaaA [Flavobacteriales bacterium]|nr:MAG: peroxide stress protein YaaA [Flavobacteriales bacterium]